MVRNMKAAQIARIVSKLEAMSNDTLAEALDEIGAMNIAEAESNMRKLSGTSVARLAKTIRDLGVPSTYDETFR